MPKSAWCSHNKHKYQIIVNLFKGKGCKSKTQTSHLNSCLFTIEKRNFFTQTYTRKISGWKRNAIPLSLLSSLVAGSVKVLDTDNRDRSVACYLQIFAMPEETGEAECAVTIEKPILRVHCDHYGDVKGCECVGIAPGVVRTQGSVSVICAICHCLLSPLPTSVPSPVQTLQREPRADCQAGRLCLMLPSQCSGKGNC